MKLYAIEITDETIPYILAHSDANPIRMDDIRNDNMFLIATYNGIYEALCWIEKDGFAQEFRFPEDLVPGEFTEVVEL